MSIKGDWLSYDKISGDAQRFLEGATGCDCARLPIRVSKHESGYEFVVPVMLNGKASALAYFDTAGHRRIDTAEPGTVLNDAVIQLPGGNGLIIAGDIVTGIKQSALTGLTVHIPISLEYAEPNEKCAVVVQKSDNYQVELAAFEFAAKNPSMVQSVVISR